MRGRVVFMNPVAEALTGWRSQDVLGVPAWQVFVVVDEGIREPMENPLTTALTRRAVVSLTKPVLLISKDGSAIPIDDSVAPILDERGSSDMRRSSCGNRRRWTRSAGWRRVWRTTSTICLPSSTDARTS